MLISWHFNKNISEGLVRYIPFSVHVLEGVQQEAKK